MAGDGADEIEIGGRIESEREGCRAVYEFGVVGVAVVVTVLCFSGHVVSSRWKIEYFNKKKKIDK